MKNWAIAILICAFSTLGALGQNAFDFIKIVGKYEGALEYADYKTDERVTLQTKLEIKTDANLNTATFAFVYDDITKIVKEPNQHRIERTGKKYFIDADEFSIAESSFANGKGKIVLLGEQIDDGKLEPVRQTVVFDENSLTILKETRRPFQFRHQYKFKRSAESEQPLVKNRAVRDSDVDRFVLAQMQQLRIPGLSLAVVRGGKTIFAKGYGLANVELSVPATPDTVYEIGSVTKQFTATAIMLLVQENKIRLDAPIGSYLSDIPAAWKTVTVRQLMNQTSGIKNYFVDKAEFLRAAHFPAVTDRILKTVANAPTLFQPGDAYDYSNTNHFLLGLIIERASGKSYARFLRERIFEPLGMRATDCNDQFAVIQNRAAGYNFDWGKNVLRKTDSVDASWSFAAGALISSVNDLAKWDAVLDTEKLVSAQSKSEMWTAGKLTSGVRHRYGFGWYVDRVNGHKNLLHGGDIAGFATYLSRYPDDKLTVIVSLNQYIYPKQIADKIAQMYLPDLIYRPIADDDAEFTSFVEKLYRNRATGESDLWRAQLFAPALWKWLAVALRENARFYRELGAPRRIELVERTADENGRLSRYRIYYAKSARLIKFVRAPDGKINDWEDYEE